MTPATTDLARRAVAAEAFRWMPSMAYVLPDGTTGVVVSVDEDGPWVLHYDEDVIASADALDLWPAAVPDLDDPATRGCLLELVRERVGTKRVWCEPFPSLRSGAPVSWACIALGVIWNGPKSPTEAEALVAALEAVSREGSA